MHRRDLNKQRAQRARRTRARIFGTAKRPRLAVCRSNRAIFAQLVNDEIGETLVAASTSAVLPAGAKRSPTLKARDLGVYLARLAKDRGIAEAVFDRRHYRYHGRVKAVAEGARQAGLKV